MTALAFVIGVVVLIVGLAISIGLHEIGHLVPAKLFGVRVGQYMVGLGPTLWSRKRGETEYGIKALPLGGYISMAGMYPPAATEGAPRRGLPARLFSTLVQDARAANEESMTGVDKSRTFYGLSVWKRVVIMFGGPFMNLLLGILMFAIVYSGIGFQTATTTVAEVSPCVSSQGADGCEAGDAPSPASAAGLMAGDVLVSIDGAPIQSFEEAIAVIQQSPNVPLEVVVDRAGSDVDLTITPAPVDSAAGTIGLIGMTSQVEFVRQPIWDGPAAAVEHVGTVAGIMVQFPVKVYQAVATVFTGDTRDVNGPLSPVGAGRLAGELASSDAPILNRVQSMVSLLGALNIALFVFNLIPLLPLDGGHILVALWDGLRRLGAKIVGRPTPAPVDASRLAPIALVVVLFLVVAAAGLILADLFNPVILPM